MGHPQTPSELTSREISRKEEQPQTMSPSCQHAISCKQPSALYTASLGKKRYYQAQRCENSKCTKATGQQAVASGWQGLSRLSALHTWRPPHRGAGYLDHTPPSRLREDGGQPTAPSTETEGPHPRPSASKPACCTLVKTFLISVQVTSFHRQAEEIVGTLYESLFCGASI